MSGNVIRVQHRHAAGDLVCSLQPQRTQGSAAPRAGQFTQGAYFSCALALHGAREWHLRCSCILCRWCAGSQLPARGARLLPPPPHRALRLTRLLVGGTVQPSCSRAQMLAARAAPAAVCMRLWQHCVASARRWEMMRASSRQGWHRLARQGSLRQSAASCHENMDQRNLAAKLQDRYHAKSDQGGDAAPLYATSCVKYPIFDEQRLSGGS